MKEESSTKILAEIDRVDHVMGESECNERLKRGWVLLAVLKGRDEFGDEAPIYVLGRPGHSESWQLNG